MAWHRLCFCKAMNFDMTFYWTDRRVRCAFLVLLLSGVVSINGQTARTTNAAILPFNSNYKHDDQHKLRAGDKISFRIEQDQDDAKSLLVTDSGEVEVPYIGRVMAASKTCKLLSEELKTLLEKEYYYRANVQVGLDSINKVRGKAYIWGQVLKTGTVDIPVDEKLTVSKAILQSGGPGAWANTKEVKIIRKSGNEQKPTTILVNLDEVMKGKIDADIALEPEDMVIIPERLIKFK